MVTSATHLQLLSSQDVHDWRRRARELGSPLRDSLRLLAYPFPGPCVSLVIRLHVVRFRHLASVLNIQQA